MLVASDRGGGVTGAEGAGGGAGAGAVVELGADMEQRRRGVSVRSFSECDEVGNPAGASADAGLPTRVPSTAAGLCCYPCCVFVYVSKGAAAMMGAAL